MILFLHGEDQFLLSRRRRDLQKAFAEKYPEADIFTFDFEDQGTPEHVRRALDACEGGLFASRKMVIILHPFELGEGPEKMLVQFMKSQKETQNDTTLLFVHPGKIKKTHPVTSLLLKQADKEENFPKQSEKDLGPITKTIERELARIDAASSFSREALRMFVSAVGGDTARVVSELEKLVAYKGERKEITIEDIALFIEGAPENVLFEALDALGRSDRKRALMLFRQEVSNTESAFPILAMCAWQTRRLLVVREAYDQGMRRAQDIASKTKLPPFAVQKMLGIISGFPLSRLKKGLEMLSSFDTKLKTGGMDPLVALDLFVSKF